MKWFRCSNRGPVRFGLQVFTVHGISIAGQGNISLVLKWWRKKQRKWFEISYNFVCHPFGLAEILQSANSTFQQFPFQPSRSLYFCCQREVCYYFAIKSSLLIDLFGKRKDSRWTFVPFSRFLFSQRRRSFPRSFTCNWIRFFVPEDATTANSFDTKSLLCNRNWAARIIETFASQKD